MSMSWQAKIEGGGNSFPLTFHTNLDLHRAEELPKVLCCRPMVGDRIESKTSHDRQPVFRLTLEVVGVKLVERGLEVELHLPKHRWESLKQFYGVYESITGWKFI